MKTKIQNYSKSVVAVLVVAMLLTSLASCKNSNQTQETTKGTITITVEIIDKDGNSTKTTIETSSSTFADALLEKGIVSEEDLSDGMVTSVNGVVADYDKDKAYWALYKGNDYLKTGLKDTKITDGDNYKIEYTKAWKETQKLSYMN